MVLTGSVKAGNLGWGMEGVPAMGVPQGTCDDPRANGVAEAIRSRYLSLFHCHKCVLCTTGALYKWRRCFGGLVLLMAVFPP